jgi:hypothetical protein
MEGGGRAGSRGWDAVGGEPQAAADRAEAPAEAAGTAEGPAEADRHPARRSGTRVTAILSATLRAGKRHHDSSRCEVLSLTAQVCC